MANPNISPGILQLLNTSVTIPAFPSLNVTPPYLGKQMVHLALSGDATKDLPVAVGVVKSPQQYLMAEVRINLIKSQGLADLYKKQWESNSILGAITVRPDTTVLSPFDLVQVGIKSVGDMAFNGEEPDLFVVLSGQYNINLSLWP